MITPLQIQEKEFQRAVRGYREDEVDEFLDEIITCMDALMRENENLRMKCEKLSRQNEKLNSTNDSVAETLNAAKKLMRQISDTAEKRAALLIRNAEGEAKQIKINAENSVIKLRNESDRLKSNVNKFKAEYRELLEKELKKVGGLVGEDSEKSDMNDPSEEKLFDGIDFVAGELSVAEDTGEMFTEEDLIKDSQLNITEQQIGIEKDENRDEDKAVAQGLPEEAFQDASDLGIVKDHSEQQQNLRNDFTIKSVPANNRIKNDSPDKELEELEMMNRQTKMFRNR